MKLLDGLKDIAPLHLVMDGQARLAGKNLVGALGYEALRFFKIEACLLL